MVPQRTMIARSQRVVPTNLPCFGAARADTPADSSDSGWHASCMN